MATSLVVLEPDDLSAFGTARRVAASRGEQLLVFCMSKDQRARLEAVEKLGVEQLGDDAPELVAAAVERVGAEDGGVEVIDCRGADVRRALLDGCAAKGVRELVFAIDPTGRSSAAFNLKRRIARSAPIDTLAIHAGGSDRYSRVLVPQIRGGGKDAIQYAARHFLDDETTIAVLPDPNALARSKRVFARTVERLAEQKRQRIDQVEPAGSLDEAIDSMLDRGDLVLASVQSARELSLAMQMLARSSDSTGTSRTSFAILRGAYGATPGWAERAIEQVRTYVPTLDRDERRETFDVLDRGGRLSTNFAVMMMLSTAIASLGLIQSSTGVVIGAMLVAPLMTPLLAIGMALVQGNTALFRRAATAMVAGIGGALGVSMVIGLLSPWPELSSEILARGSPNVFDLGIALLSGCAAAFALARPGLAGTLVGVAIAVALVPPLASTGIATVKGYTGVAIGAGVLFATNLLAIIVGAAIVFASFGLGATHRGATSPGWVRLVSASLVVGLLAIGGVLLHNLVGQTHHGVHRPYERPLPSGLRDAIRDRVAEASNVELVTMSESELADDFGVQVLLLRNSIEPTDDALEQDLIELIRSRMGRDVSARVLFLSGATPPSAELPAQGR